LKSKSNEGTLYNRNDRRRDKSISRLRIYENDIIRLIKIDRLTFEVSLIQRFLVIGWLTWITTLIGICLLIKVGFSLLDETYMVS